jgi:hypothetical protein
MIRGEQYDQIAIHFTNGMALSCERYPFHKKATVLRSTKAFEILTSTWYWVVCSSRRDDLPPAWHMAPSVKRTNIAGVYFQKISIVVDITFCCHSIRFEESKLPS